jgi:hypothetical protein
LYKIAAITVIIFIGKRYPISDIGTETKIKIQMDNRIETTNQDLLSLAKASEITGYHQDYLGSLCRSGRLRGQKIGRNWVTTQEYLNEFLAARDATVEEEVQPSAAVSASAAIIASVEGLPIVLEAVSEQRIFQAGSIAGMNTLAQVRQRMEHLSLYDQVTQLTEKVAAWDTSTKAEAMMPSPAPEVIALKHKLASNFDFGDSADGLVQEAEEAVLSPNKVQQLYQSFISVPRSSKWTMALATVAAVIVGSSAFAAAHFGVLKNFVGSKAGTQSITYGTQPQHQAAAANTEVITPANTVPGQLANDGKVLGTQVTARIGQPAATITEDYIDRLILFNLENLMASGWLKGEKGDPGQPGYSYAPISYIAPTGPASSGASLFAATDLSSQRFYTDHATINSDLTVNGGATFNGSVNLAGGTLNPGFTVGSVAFQGSSGLTQNNANFFWNNTDNRLGLGTASPAKTLDVSGEIRIYNQTAGTGVTGLALRAGAGQAGNNLLTVQNNSGVGITVVDAAGRLGIGTTSPIGNLDLRQLNNGDPIVYARRNTDSTPTGNLITYTSADGNTDLFKVDNNGSVTTNGTLAAGTAVSAPLVTSAAALALTPAAGSNLNVNLSGTGDLAINTNQLYVDTSSGNVGIGTASPNYKLVVGPDFGAGFAWAASTISKGAGQSVSMVVGSSTTKLIEIAWDESNNRGAVNAPGTTPFAFLQNGTNVRLLINSSGNLEIGGHLLGTVDNTYDLGGNGANRIRTGYFGTSVVAPTVNATSTIQLNGTSINTGGTLSNVAYLNQANTFSLNNTFSTSVTTPILYGGTGSSSTLSLAGTSNGIPSNAHVILNGSAQGNVGIGDTSPAALLTVGTGDLFQVTSAGLISTIPSSNSNALTITGSSITSAKLLNLDARNTSGIIASLGYGAAATLAGSLTGQSIDLQTNVTPGTNAVTGLSMALPAVSANGSTIKGISVSGGQFRMTGTNNGTWSGIDVTTPTFAQFNDGIPTLHGIRVALTSSAVDAGVSVNGLTIDGSALAGFQNASYRGINITSITNGDTLSETGLYVGSGWDYAAVFNGKVGIGTTNPGHKLHVAGASTDTSGILSTISYPTAATLTGTITGQVIDLMTNVTATNQSATGLSISLPSNSSADTDTVQGIVITPGGSFNTPVGGVTSTWNGIAITTTTSSTSSAASIPIVNGLLVALQHNSALQGEVSGIKIDPEVAGSQQGTYRGVYVGDLVNNSGSATETGIYVGAHWDYGAIFASGNVGIGTTNPITKLQIGSDNDTVSNVFRIVTGNTAGANTVASFLVGGVTENTISVLHDTGELSFGFNPNSHSIADLRTAAKLTILPSGKVGIGDTTSISSANLPSGSLVIGSGALCVDNGSGTCDDASRTAGNIYAKSSTVTAVDLAENYPSKLTDLEAGEVVRIDSANKEYVTRTTRAYDSLQVGIISTEPGITLGGFGGQDRFGDKQYPVALAGRVPVKVTNENGNIRPGDYLTSSELFAGYAMKATRSGQVIGQALEGFSSATPGDSGTIITFIKVGYQQINNTIVLEAPQTVDATDQASLQGTSQTGILTSSSSSSAFVIKQATGDSAGMGSILQVQSGETNRLMVASNGATIIAAGETRGINNIFVVSNNGSNAFVISARGTAYAYGTLVVKKDLAVLGTILGSTGLIAKNVSQQEIEQGDIVVLAGAAESVFGNNPVLAVRKAASLGELLDESIIVVGIADRNLAQFTIDPQASLSSDGTKIATDEYLSVVTSGTFKSVKVDAQYGAILAGDKLTISESPGYARKLLYGENKPVIGVALDSQTFGTGSVRVYLMLNSTAVTSSSQAAVSGTEPTRSTTDGQSVSNRAQPALVVTQPSTQDSLPTGSTEAISHSPAPIN